MLLTLRTSYDKPDMRWLGLRAPRQHSAPESLHPCLPSETDPCHASMQPRTYAVVARSHAAEVQPGCSLEQGLT